MSDDRDLLPTLESRMAGGLWDEARELLRQTPARQEDGSAVAHGELARIAEQLGDVDRAILEYNLALKIDSRNEVALRRLARLRSDRGELDRAIRAYRRLVDLRPQDLEAALELAGVLEDSGRPAEACAVLDGSPHRSDPLVSQRLARLKRPDVSARVDLDAEDPAEELVVPSDSDLVTFASVFAGREGVYARQWVSPTGQHGYTPIHEPFTASVARSHLLGAFTVGVYPVRMDNTTPFLAFDLDAARFALSRDARSGRGSEAILKQVQGVARRLVDAGARHELAPLIEDSGWKGRHVWFLFEPPVPAAAARRLADVLLAAAGEPPPEVTIEVFPKQARVNEGSLGNLIKLPLGIHRVTGRRSSFVDADGRPVRGQLAALRTAARIGREQLRRILEVAAPGPAAGPIHTDASLPGEAPEVPAGEPAGRPSTKAIQETYDPDRDLELQWILQKCTVLAEVVRRARANGVLSNDERNALTYTVGHLPNGPGAVNSVLTGLLSVDGAAFLKSRLKGNPMSCPKIRSRLPDVAAGVGCSCRFEADAGLYPNPLLHLSDLRLRGDLERGVPRLTILQVERLMSDLVRTRSEADRMTRLALEIERRLVEFMQEQAVTELRTAGGRLGLEAGGRLALMLPAAQRADGGGPDEHPLRDGAGGGGGTEGSAAGGEEGAGAPPGPASR